MTKHESLAPNPRVSIGNVEVSNDARIAVFAGPCQMESRGSLATMPTS